MLVQIRFVANGVYHSLPRAIDLNKFNEEQIRTRLVEYGFSYDTELTVVSILDLKVKQVKISLKMAYALNLAINELYNGDSLVIKTLLNKGFSAALAISNYFLFETNSEEQIFEVLLERMSKEEIINLFLKYNKFEIMHYLEQNLYVVSTAKGFYINSALSNKCREWGTKIITENVNA